MLKQTLRQTAWHILKIAAVYAGVFACMIALGLVYFAASGVPVNF